MAILFALLSAFAFGISDFAGGIGSRKSNAWMATLFVQISGLLVASLAVAIFPGEAPSTGALAWGAASGVGTAVGAFALYRGIVVGRISVVAPISAVITALLPALLGLALGERLSGNALLGIALAVPAIALVALQTDVNAASKTQAGIPEGIVSGLGFAWLFIALDQAGTQFGAWPVVTGQAVSVLLVLPFAWKMWAPGTLNRITLGIVIAGGIFGGAANLLFLAATGYGQLAIVSVLTSLYPATTIVLARVFLHERLLWIQIAGLFMAAGAVVLLSL